MIYKFAFSQLAVSDFNIFHNNSINCVCTCSSDKLYEMLDIIYCKFPLFATQMYVHVNTCKY